MLSDLMRKPVLILNASYEPLSISSGRRALKLIMKGAAVALETHENIPVYRKTMWDEETGDYVDIRFDLPSVVKLTTYRNVPVRVQIFTRTNVYNRDGYKCQYCGVKYSHNDLTLDHVFPQSKGGKNTFENVVAACQPCNRLKGDRLLEEVIWYPGDFPVKAMRGQQMKLIHPPRQVTIHTCREILRNKGKEDPKWRKYLYFSSDSWIA